MKCLTVFIIFCTSCVCYHRNFNAFHNFLVQGFSHQFMTPVSFVKDDHINQFQPFSSIISSDRMQQVNNFPINPNLGQSWLPLGSKSNFHQIKPNNVEIAQRNYVVWKTPTTDKSLFKSQGGHENNVQDEEEQWNVMIDSCPHRLAPLSQGRINKQTRCLECPYHGWQFQSKTGECSLIPQLNQAEMKLRTQSNPNKTTLTSYPVEITGDIIWALLPLPIGQASTYTSNPNELFPELKHVKYSFTRELPYSFDFLVESLMDISNIPLLYRLLLNRGIPGIHSSSDLETLNMEIVSDINKNDTHCEIAFNNNIDKEINEEIDSLFIFNNFNDNNNVDNENKSKTNVLVDFYKKIDVSKFINKLKSILIKRKDIRGAVTFTAPCYYSINLQSDKHNNNKNNDNKYDKNYNNKLKLLALAVPISPGRSRLIITLPNHFHWIPQWLSHMVMNSLLDDDSWIHDQEVLIRSNNNDDIYNNINNNNEGYDHNIVNSSTSHSDIVPEEVAQKKDYSVETMKSIVNIGEQLPSTPSISLNNNNNSINTTAGIAANDNKITIPPQSQVAHNNNPTNNRNKYTLMSDSDIACAGWRFWWSKHMSLSPVFGIPPPGPSPTRVINQYNKMSFQQKHDHFENHIKNCRQCQQALKGSLFIHRWLSIIPLLFISIGKNIMTRIAGIALFAFMELIVSMIIRTLRGPSNELEKHKLFG
eukprot:gene6504-8941_t